MNCTRCGKKLGTEVTDIHTCTPKEIQPVAWLTRDKIDGCWYATNKKESINDKPLYIEPLKKEWVGLIDEERIDCEIRAEHNWVLFADIIEAKLKEKNYD